MKQIVCFQTQQLLQEFQHLCKSIDYQNSHFNYISQCHLISFLAFLFFLSTHKNENIDVTIDRYIYRFNIYLVQKIKKHEVGESQYTEFILDSVPCIYIHSWYIKYLKSGLFAQSYLTLCDPMDCSPPGSSVRGIFQARILEWVAIPFSRESSPPRY